MYVEENKRSNLDNLTGKAITNPLLRSGLILNEGGEISDQSEVYEYNRKDGILTSYEVMNMSLDNTELVVLSACETALGKVELGEGVFGLQRSFFVAGADMVIVSLFKVSDDITVELMAAFYKQMLVLKNKREAFIYAKKQIKKKYDNPIYWGAFIMIGIE